MYKATLGKLIQNVFYEVMDEYLITRTKEEINELVNIWQLESDIHFKEMLSDNYKFLHTIRQLGQIYTTAEFPVHMDGARVLELVKLDYIIDPIFNRIHEKVEEDEYDRQIKYLVICQYNNDPQNFYLFHINRNFKVIWDTAHLTSEEAKGQAELEYPGTFYLWEKVTPKNP